MHITDEDPWLKYSKQEGLSCVLFYENTYSCWSACQQHLHQLHYRYHEEAWAESLPQGGCCEDDMFVKVQDMISVMSEDQLREDNIAGCKA